MDKNKKVLIGTLVGVVVLAAIGAVVYFATQKEPAPAPVVEQPKAGEDIESPSLGGTIYDKVEETSNPASNMPQTNPFETKSNPYSDSYQNPFD